MTDEANHWKTPTPEEEAHRRLRGELTTGDPRADYAAAVAEMSAFELQYGLTSESFYERYRAGAMKPTDDLRRWAVRYEMYRDLYPDLAADLLLLMGRADQPLT